MSKYQFSSETIYTKSRQKKQERFEYKWRDEAKYILGVCAVLTTLIAVLAHNF